MLEGLKGKVLQIKLCDKECVVGILVSFDRDFLEIKSNIGGVFKIKLIQKKSIVHIEQI